MSKRIEYLSLVISTLNGSIFKKPVNFISVIESIEKESSAQLNKLSHFYKTKLKSL